ncbi:MAG: hypothetical protein GYB31_16705 [Bacteroidetes bacterium]|nr:hypothetical protein [Bacteroidota bacterium]
MKNYLLTTLVSFFFISGLFSQRALNGLWVGTLTQGGETYDVKLVLSKDGRKLKGSSLIVLSDTSYIELHLTGIYHEDRSMNVYEVEVLYPDPPDAEAGYFKRTYQMLYKRSFDDHFLEGWWQEREKSATDEKRRFGRIYLEKSNEDVSGA